MMYKKMVVLTMVMAMSSFAGAGVFTDDFDVSAGPRVNPGWISLDPAVLPADSTIPAKIAAATGNPGAANGVADGWNGGSGDKFYAAPQNGVLGNEQKVTVEVDAIFAGDLTEFNFGNSGPVGIWNGDSMRLGLRKDGPNPSLWVYSSLGADPDSNYSSAPNLLGISDDNWHSLKVEYNGIGDDTLKVWVDGTLYIDFDLATHHGGALNNRINLDYTQLYMNLAGSNGAWDNLSITTVPEPVTMVLLGLGGLLAARRRRS